MFILRWSWITIIFIAVLLGTGCTAHSGNTHNDQRNCTHDCNIGSSEPAYVPSPVFVTPTYYPRIYGGYRRGYGRGYGHGRGHRRGGRWGGAVIIHR